MENLWNEYSPLIVEYGTGLVYALLVLIFGFWIAKLITKSIKKMMLKGEMDDSLVPFLSSLISTVLKLLVVISALGMLGIEMTSFIALLGAAGLAVGMALSGTLQNFAGGVMILIFKPFKAGDFIDAQGHMGVVKEIQIFNTILTTGDNKTIIIPNGGLSTGAMVNFSTQPKRRVDWTFGIGYGDDADKAKQVLRALLDTDKRILQDPEPFIALSELADSSVNFVVRAWVNASDYWGVYFAMNENVYKTFEKEGLNIPYPQMDIHLDK
jgi:small conductance mechanosensitive channel